MKFKVGDEVKLGGGRAKVIHIESTGDFPYLVERADNRIEFCNDAEMMPLLPAIPAGWTPADEPAAKARYVVCAIPTEHDTLEEAELHALRAMESLRVNVVIARVVEEVKPGKPEIIRMEE